MDSSTLSRDNLEKMLRFLANENNEEFEDFLANVFARMTAKEEKLKNLANEISQLKLDDREYVLSLAGVEPCVSRTDCPVDDFEEADPALCQEVKVSLTDAPSETVEKKDGNNSLNESLYPLKTFLQQSISDLVRSKPVLLIINGESFKVKSWKDISLEFVRYLVEKQELTMHDLPLCPNPRSSKVFINSIPGQNPGTGKSGLFMEATDNFYVDIKFNAKYHILNIWRTLEFLNISSKYDIYIGLQKPM